VSNKGKSNAQRRDRARLLARVEQQESALAVAHKSAQESRERADKAEAKLRGIEAQKTYDALPAFTEGTQVCPKCRAEVSANGTRVELTGAGPRFNTNDISIAAQVSLFHVYQEWFGGAPRSAPLPEHLVYTCRCGYQWRTKAADAGVSS
jgi:DNA-directed RNA polymerase subunit M/transcription elongation factor TFIIS